jgi:SNF2 family DNA or RNA helicase
MDLTAIDTYLARAREQNDCTMRPCGLVTREFLPLPAHHVGVAHLMLRPRMVLADPTGCGKTPQTLVAYGYLKEKQPSFRLLVITGKSSQFQWRDSVYRFLAGVNASVIGYTDSKTKLTPAARAARYADLQHCHVLITTYAMLAKDEAHILPPLKDFAVVYDEVHHVDNRKQQTLFPACQRVASKAKVAWGLSATPMDNGKLDELYSLFELLRPGTLGDYPSFRKTYFVLKLVKPMWKDKKTGARARPFYEVLGTQNLPHLAARIDKFYLRRPAERIRPGLPPVTFTTDSIELGPRQRHVYDEIVDGHWPDAKTKIDQLAAMVRAQQAADAPEILGFDVGNAKLDRLVERLQTDLLGTKVLVYSKFLEVVRVIERRLLKEKILYARITGEDSVRARDTARERFTLERPTPPSPTVRHRVVTPEASGDAGFIADAARTSSQAVNVLCITDAGGESLDLQAAQTVILFDLPWEHGKFEQIVGRARRIGSQHANILVLLLAAEGTLDEQIVHVLRAKERIIRQAVPQGKETVGLAEQLQRADEDVLLEALF